MRIFISYARVDKPYCVQIAEMLDIHETWYDQRLYAGQDWWKEILQRLDWCEGFIYLMSPDSLASEYCQKEYLIAQRIGKPIFPVLIHSEAQIPEVLAKFQYVDLSRGLTSEGTRALLNAIFVTERNMNFNGRSHRHAPEPRLLTTTGGETGSATATADVHDPAAVIGKAAEAMEAGDYDGAVFLLRRALETGYRSRFIDLNGLLNEAEAALERQTRQREIEREYQTIAELVKRRRTRAHGCHALAAFRKAVPDYDPENLYELCADVQAAQAVRPESLPRIASKPRFSLPLLEWCSISGGNVILSDPTHAGNSAGKSLHFAGQSQLVEPFRIAKYPVTNTQYQIFVDDLDGYCNPKWWGYSAFAQAWRSSNPKPADSQFKGEERPRENVTWFEAMAYCFWLSEKMDLPIMLPTKQQWRRAAQGDDGRIYPWGNDFDTSFCNTRESRIRMTTLVMRYDRGLSPYGVYDMAGNVWEWCLNSAYDDLAITTDRPRAVQGGSFIGAHERAQINFSFDLAPDYHYGSIGFRLACALDS
ncbi:MAG: formylglycine-generating enzyme family protein [Anaerolineae bacterium]|nr:formylglycine-generating enzyme family protein [Anaerolineae bacterium]